MNQFLNFLKKDGILLPNVPIPVLSIRVTNSLYSIGCQIRFLKAISPSNASNCNASLKLQEQMATLKTKDKKLSDKFVYINESLFNLQKILEKQNSARFYSSSVKNILQRLFHCVEYQCQYIVSI